GPRPDAAGGLGGRGIAEATAPAPVRWLNRNVLGIGLADLASDANYEMVLAVLPLFITAGLGAPALAVGLVEGVADGSSAAVKVWSGWYSDRIAWRKSLAAGGYGATGFGFALLLAVASWPQVLLARALAWVGRGVWPAGGEGAGVQAVLRFLAAHAPGRDLRRR